jgi:hypothetical protein
VITLRELGAEALRKKLEESQRLDMLDGGASVTPGLGMHGVADALRSTPMGMSRKASAQARLKVDAEDHLDLLHAHVYAMYSSHAIKKEVAAHVSRTRNLQRMVTDAVAVVYDRPPSRSLRGASEADAAAFRAAYREAKTDVEAEQWGRYAVFLGVVHVLPRYEGTRLRWVTVLPNTADVVFDPSGLDDVPSILVYEAGVPGARWIAVDSERWWWISEAWEVVADEEHGMGMTPWVTFRWRRPPPGDYWDRHCGADLLEATLELGRVAASARWTRKHWSKKLLTAHFDGRTVVPPGQDLNAQQPLVTEDGQAPKYEVHDTVVGMDEFVREMREIIESVCEARGIPSNLIDFNTRSSEDAANAFPVARVGQHEALIKLRNRQIKHFDEAEGELAVRAAALLKRHGRMVAGPDEVRDMFRCRFHQPNFADHPKARVETLQAEMSVFARSPVDWYMQENPGVTEDEARDEIRRNADDRAFLNGLSVAYNLPGNPADDTKNLAQLQGQLGGRRSGEVRQDDESADEAEDTEDQD